MCVLYQELIAPDTENTWAEIANSYSFKNYILPDANLETASYSIRYQEGIVTVDYCTEQYFCSLIVNKHCQIDKIIYSLDGTMLTENGQQISYILNNNNDQFHTRSTKLVSTH